MIERITDKRVSTPAFARNVVGWAIKSAPSASSPAESDYALITAKVFTAFMVEGTVDHVGERLCSTWNLLPEKKALARQSLEERHKTVRGFLGLDNSGGEYQEIRLLIGRLIAFRDSFAHPKLHRETVQDRVPSELDAIPEIAWEKDRDAAKIEADFRALEKYSQSLLDSAAACLERALADVSDLARQAYPHLQNLDLEAAQLRNFLHSPSWSFSNTY
jgi:hypothetical protein